MAGQRLTSFTWQLQQKVAELNSASDGAGFFLSPISLYIALGLAMSGAGKHVMHAPDACVIPGADVASAAAVSMHKTVCSLIKHSGCCRPSTRQKRNQQQYTA